MAFHPRESLIAPTLINRENEEDRAIRALVGIEQFASWAESRRPNAVLVRNLHRLQVYALHYEEAGLRLIHWSLVDFSFPLIMLSLTKGLLPMVVGLLMSSPAASPLVPVVMTSTFAVATTRTPIVVIIMTSTSVWRVVVVRSAHGRCSCGK